MQGRLARHEREACEVLGSAGLERGLAKATIVVLHIS